VKGKGENNIWRGAVGGFLEQGKRAF